MASEGQDKPRTKGLVLVFTGDGKGKTTAAVGMAMRAVGHHYRVAVVQFIKGTMRTGEQEAARMLAPYLDWTVTGRGFTNEAFSKVTPEEHHQAAQEALRIAEEKVRSGDYRMVVLDEVLGAIKAGLVTTEQLLALIGSNAPRPPPGAHRPRRPARDRAGRGPRDRDEDDQASLRAGHRCPKGRRVLASKPEPIGIPSQLPRVNPNST